MIYYLKYLGLASAVIMGRMGSILAPFIVDLSVRQIHFSDTSIHIQYSVFACKIRCLFQKSVYRDLPNIIFGMVSVGAAFVALCLPETRNVQMYNDIGDLERDATERKGDQESKSVKNARNSQRDSLQSEPDAESFIEKSARRTTEETNE